MGQRMEVGRLDRLVDGIYATVFSEGTWQDFLKDVNDLTSGGGATLMHYDARRGIGAYGIHYGMDEWTRVVYGNYYSGINPWMKAAAVRPVGIGIVAEQMYPREGLQKTEFYADYMQRIEWESAIGITVVREKSQSFILTSGTCVHDESVQREAADTLTRLAPHLQRAYRHFRSSTRTASIETLGASLFDAVGISLVHVGESRILKSASPMAERLLADGRVIGLTPTGQVRFLDGKANDLCNQMLSRYYAGSRSVTIAVGLTKLTFVQPIRDELSVYFEGPSVFVLVEEGRRDASIPLEELASTFGLTRGELRTMQGILEGLDVSLVAERAGLSRETIRSQLKSLYAKTGTGGQLDLVRLVHGRPPAGRLDA